MHQFNRARIQSRPGELREVTTRARSSESVFDIWQIDASFASLSNRLPRRFKFQRDGQFAGKHIDGAQRQYSEAGALKSLRLVADAIEHLVQSAITAR